MTDLPMNCDEFTDKLAEFLERDVSESTRAAIEAHALECGECGPLLADLRRLRIDAANLPELAPSRDLWAGIAERIETPVVELPRSSRTAVPVRRVSRRVWVGLAAAALVAVTATVTREITRRSIETSRETTTVATRGVPTSTQPLATMSSPPSVTSSDSSARPEAAITKNSQAVTPMRAVSNKQTAEQTYDHEIAGLLAVYKFKQHDLDSSTVAVVARNMAIIDSAIAQCRLALRRDPASGYLMQSLNDALDTKVQLLRTAAALPASRM
jgi:hypothetical protein